MSNDPLLQPYQLKHLTLKNRIFSTSHEPYYSEDGLPKDRYRLYHLEKAKGGCAMTMTAGSAVVSPDSPEAFGNLHAYRDEIVPWLTRLADDCHAEGCAVMIQLTHLGWRTNWNKADWLPVMAPSPLREHAHRAFAKEMEEWDIARVIDDFAAAAERIKAAGLDGFELMATGHLMDAFWSPHQNRRDDAWGGDFDRRLAFTWAVIDAVRAAVGDDFIVGIRMVADEVFDKGITREMGLEIGKRIAESGKFDFINLVRGRIATDAELTSLIPVHGMKSAPHLDFAGEMKSHTKFPVFHAAKIADVATARHAVATGKLDMVGMTRAQIADPHLVRKTAARQDHRIRPCVGATYCIDRIYEAGGALCVHNASTGREGELPHAIPRADVPKRAVIVGAGPAGLEAARVAAERGHQVTVFEASDRAGGQINLLAANPRRRDFVGIVDWRLSELDLLGVDIRYNTYAEAEDVLALSPDVVVIATGGLPQPPEMDGDALTVSSWDILSGAVQPADRVLVYDDNGGHPGMSAAEVLARQGAEVELVSPERALAPEMGGLNHAPYMTSFHETGVTVITQQRLRSVRRDGNALVATFGSDFTPAFTRDRHVDQVVVEHGTAALDELYHALRPLARNRGEVDYTALIGRGAVFPDRNPDGAFWLYRIGDAIASRNIHAGIYDAMRYGVRW
ncbi:MAG: NADH:flavin oxidoreductase [Pseudomonadota bacterium]